MSESAGAREDCPMVRLNVRASNADSFSIKYKRKSRTACHPIQTNIHSLLTHILTGSGVKFR